jgi:hypothetical protein
MKSRTLTCITAITLFAALAITGQLAAQEQGKEHLRYKLVDLGTFGGPSARTSSACCKMLRAVPTARPPLQIDTFD